MQQKLCVYATLKGCLIVRLIATALPHPYLQLTKLWCSTMHAHAHKRTRKSTHSHTRVHTHILTHTPTNARTHAHAHSHTPTHTHTHTPTHTGIPVTAAREMAARRSTSGQHPLPALSNAPIQRASTLCNFVCVCVCVCVCLCACLGSLPACA